jgi:hypothetical protein
MRRCPVPRPTFAKETIIRLRYPSRIEYGTQVVDYTGTPDRKVIGKPEPGLGCWLEPLVSIEENSGRTAVYTGYNCDAPFDADVKYDDHVIYEGVEYEVVGDPLRQKSPTGAISSTKIVLHVWRG